MRVWGQSRVEVKGLNEELRNGKLKKLKIIFVSFFCFYFFPNMYEHIGQHDKKIKRLHSGRQRKYSSFSITALIFLMRLL